MQHDDNTETLVIRWRAGSRDAGDRLLRRYALRLAGFFGRRSGGNEQELVQRTLTACAQGLERFEGRSSFRSYVFGIARNQYLMYRRSEARSGCEPVTLPTRVEDNPSQLAAVRQEHVILILALRRLEPEFSLVLRKYYLEELPIEKLAHELGIPVGTVKSRLARGRAALREEVSKVRLRDDLRQDALRELSQWLAKRSD